jgi:hypothetical protein
MLSKIQIMRAKHANATTYLKQHNDWGAAFPTIVDGQNHIND